MLNYRDADKLEEVLKRCNRIKEKTDNIERHDFEKNEDIKEIVCFNLL